MLPTLTSFFLHVCRSANAFRRAVILLALTALLPAMRAAGAAAKRHYQFSAGDAAITLRQFVEQSGEQVIYLVQKVRGVKTNEVKGEYTAREVLDRLVANTCLVVVEDAKTGALTVTVVANPKKHPGPAAPASEPNQNSSSQPPSTSMKRKNLLAVFLSSIAFAAPAPAASALSESSAKEEPVVLSIFQVTGDKDEGYRSTQTVSGSRTLSNLRDTPPSISVLNREIMDDLITTKISDAMFFSITGEIDTNKENLNETFVFRGIPASQRLRNGVTWFGGVGDSYNVERVELLRGPQAFLYGEGSSGGMPNTITKQPAYRNFDKTNLIFGSNDSHRVEVDVNRRLSDKLAARAVLAYGREGSFQDFAERKFWGAYLAVNWKPFKNTTINADLEYRFNNGVEGMNMLADGLSVTPITGASTTLTATTGGRTYVPALGMSYDTVGLRRSTGTSIVLSDESILSRRISFLGPDAVRDSTEKAASLRVDQKISEKFTLNGSFTYFDIMRFGTQRVGSSSSAVYRDLNPTLPGGAANPYFNELYTEYYNQRRKTRQPVRNVQLNAVYEWELPLTTQKIVANAAYQDAEPRDYSYSEFVDSASGRFKGALNNANTLAAYQANVAAYQQNFFYRRFYLKDGDRAVITNLAPVPGQSINLRDMVADGSGGRLADRLYQVPAYGIGADGSYFGGRLHTLLGWRRNFFTQDTNRDFYNPTTGETFRLPGYWVHTRIQSDTYSYGAVLYLAKEIGLYYNHADAISLSSGFGGAMLNPGKVRGPQIGDGQEFGLRLAFLGGRLESNLGYYVNNAARNSVNPAIPASVRQTELGAIFGSEIDVNGGDIQTTKSTGWEMETVANLTKSWRLTLNFSNNDLKTSERYPYLKAFQALAKLRNRTTPDTDAFLASAPDGTPLPGFTKNRANLVTRYRFDSGPLKAFSIGAAVQYRAKSYQGNFDLNRDGVAEELWSSGYTLFSLMTGYRTKILKRNVEFSLNVFNLFDKDYFRSFALATGEWGDGRNFRFAARIDL